MSMVRWFRVVAVVESISYLVLLAAAVGKRVLDVPELTMVMGPIHGTIFLAYAALTLIVRDELSWTWGRAGVVALASIVPFGGIMVERRFLQDVHPAPTPTPVPTTEPA